MKVNPNSVLDDIVTIREDLNQSWCAMQQIIDWASPCSHYSRDADKIPSLKSSHGSERDRKAAKWICILPSRYEIQKLDDLLKAAIEKKAEPEILAVCLGKVFGSMRNGSRFESKVYFDGVMDALSQGPQYSAYGLLEATSKLIKDEVYVPSIAEFYAKIKTQHRVLIYKAEKLNALKALKHEVDLHLKSVREKEQKAEPLLV